MVAPGRLTFVSEKPEDMFSSVTFDKAKIWANKYVDFRSLLSVSPEESKYLLSVANGHDQPILCLGHVRPKWHR